ncbi:hypothetical protein AAIH70_30255 [Neorhizobium sp. BT27B]|uniref:hypothetical protein n=1 Tax=Neorhizobium sp. BT27B TaxID=3142625 RepID=UPI003D28A0CB
MLQSIGMQPGLSDILLERASRYTPDPVKQTKLADRTIAAALDNIDFIDDPYPELALYTAMHRLAREDALTDAKPAAESDGQG